MSLTSRPSNFVSVIRCRGPWHPNHPEDQNCRDCCKPIGAIVEPSAPLFRLVRFVSIFPTPFLLVIHLVADEPISGGEDN
jgi:hypothetical protein